MSWFIMEQFFGMEEAKGPSDHWGILSKTASHKPTFIL